MPAESPPEAAESSAAESSAADPSPAGPVTPKLLALCASSEAAVREYCLTQLERAPTLPPAAQEPLANMASSDSNLSARARALYLRTYGAEPPAPSSLPADPSARERKSDAEPPPGDPTRVIGAPTAFTRPAGRFGFNAFELDAMSLDYGVTKNVQLGIQAALPIGFLAFGAAVKVGVAWDDVALAVRGNALVIHLTEFLDDDTPTAGFYGAGPVLTFGDSERYLNFGAQFYGLHIEGENPAGLALPNIGGSVRLSKATRLGAELYVPASLEEDSSFGEFAALLWGIRLFGDDAWGDVALVEPMCDGCSDLYQVIPLGIPFLNIGGSW